MLVALASLVGSAGCAATDDDVATTEDDLAANGNDGFWRVVEQDTRKCAFPRCGGVYVAKVNGAQTRCADGSVADKCYVAQIDLSKLGLPAEQEADVLAQALAGNVILRTKGLTTGRVDMPSEADSATSNRSTLLKAVEGWSRLAPTTDSSFAGTVYRATDSGIRCITAPCPSLNAAKINGRKNANVTGIDLGAVAPQPSQEELDAAWGSLATGGFLFATTDTGLALAANAVYTRVAPREEQPEPQACGGRGMGQCAQGESCIYTLAAACGSFDAPGHCQLTTAMLCPQIVNPVCGCDGVTYNNECMANLAGTSAMKAGACAPPQPELPPCHVGGCSSQVCSERQGIITTCEFKAEYACYHSATCERQDSGKCGWTQTPELTSCIDNSR
jgi:hypothetical protein